MHVPFTLKQYNRPVLAGKGYPSLTGIFQSIHLLIK